MTLLTTSAFAALAHGQSTGVSAAASGAAATTAAASAQPASQGVPQAVKDQARQLYDAGRAAEDRKDPGLAYQHYRAAYDLFHHWQIAGALGHIAFELGKRDEAARGLDQFLREAEGLAPSERNQRTKERDDAKKGLALLMVRAPAGTKVSVDGVVVGTAPLPPGGVFVFPGERKVTGKLGDIAMEATATASAGAEGAEVELKAPPPKPEVSAAPTASVTAAPTVAPTSSGGAGWFTASPRNIAIVTGGAVVLAGVAVGIGLAVTASGKREERERLCPDLDCPPNVPDQRGQRLEDDWATFTNASGGAFLVAGLAAAGTVVLALTLPGDSAKKTAFTVRSAGARLMITGEF